MKIIFFKEKINKMKCDFSSNIKTIIFFNNKAFYNIYINVKNEMISKRYFNKKKILIIN